MSAAISARVTLGVIVGLVIGKPLGIYLFSIVAIRANVAVLPAGLTGQHVLGAGAVAGIGFTVALFIASLGFEDPARAEAAVIGILVASVLASVVGWLILRSVDSAAPAEDTESVLVEA